MPREDLVTGGFDCEGAHTCSWLDSARKDGNFALVRASKIWEFSEFLESIATKHIVQMP